MKYGFIIDNRKCIGCHACTTACKSEHDVPIGVNRTWVKQVEKGVFPDTRRLFSVMRCNHCTDAPCVEICPIEALYYRDDGIVDFDDDRCIGCKSCMQACPYDALYIDPQKHTAAKCNYCAHRIDIGLEPACVNVCPEHAIISGDMDNPESEIAQLLARQQVSIRKAEKGTSPNLFYIDADEASLNPSATQYPAENFWNSQTMGVGHYAKEAEKLAFSNTDVVSAIMETERQTATAGDPAKTGSMKSIELLVGKDARRTYDTPNKGILWGWEVSGYVLTKAIAAGAFLVPFLATLFGWADVNTQTGWWGLLLGLVFLLATGVLLVLDLDKPKRFVYVLLRPHWSSWLVRGGYAITIYGGLLSLLAVALFFEWSLVQRVAGWVTALTAILVAIYTAFLFGQAKGRDFWQSPMLALHMLIHSLMAGGAAFFIVALFTDVAPDWVAFLTRLLYTVIGLNLITIIFELTTTHPTVDAKRVVDMIIRGRYSRVFFIGAIALGNLLPLAMIIFSGGNSLVLASAGLLLILGIYITEHIWVEAPQRIPLT